MVELEEQLRSYFDAVADEIVDAVETSWARPSPGEDQPVLVPAPDDDDQP